MRQNIDYRTAKKRILPVLIGRTASKYFPDGIITIDFLDFSVVFVYIPAADKEKSTLVDNELLKSFRISYDCNFSKITLFSDAVANARRYQPATICKLKDLLPLPEWLESELDHKIYVLSTGYSDYGASALLDRKILEQFATRIGESFNIIPSSIHEVLLIPDSVGISPEDLHEMLLDVNSSVLLPDEVLGTNIYRFDPESHGLIVLHNEGKEVTT